MTDAPPFSRWVKVDALPADGLTQTIEASPDERAALAALNGLPAIASLKANFTVRRSGRGGARVTGEVHAEVTQVCVVSLEPFAAIVDEPVDVRFAPAEAAEAARRVKDDEAETVEIGGEDPPDPIVDGKIDLGALAAEFFALGLDPYPRKPGIAFDPPEPRRPRGLAVRRARRAEEETLTPFRRRRQEPFNSRAARDRTTAAPVRAGWRDGTRSPRRPSARRIACRSAGRRRSSAAAAISPAGR